MPPTNAPFPRSSKAHSKTYLKSGGLLPSHEVEESLSCMVRLYRTVDKWEDMDIRANRDDTLCDIKKKVLMALGRRGEDRGGAKTANELYAWRNMGMSTTSAVEYIVDAAMDSGGKNVIGPRIVSTGHLQEVFERLTEHEKHGASTITQSLSFLTWQEAVQSVHQRLGDSVISVPLGFRHILGSSNRKNVGRAVVMHAHPLTAMLDVDPHMSSADGNIRDLYVTRTDQDGDTLETIFKNDITSSKTVIHLHMIDIHRVWERILTSSRPSSDHEGLRAGFLRKYFPTSSTWSSVGRETVEQLRQHEIDYTTESEAFCDSVRAINDTIDRLRQERASAKRCVLTNVSIQYRASDALSRASLNDSTGLNLLAVMYSKFKVTRDVPVVRYNNGYSSTYKVSQVALTTNRQEVKDYLTKCTRTVAVSSLSRVSASTALSKQALYFLVAVGQGDVVIVHLRPDMSYDVIRHFSPSSQDGGGTFEDVSRSHTIVTRKVIHVLKSIVAGMNASSVVLVEDKLNDWSDLHNQKKLRGTTVVFGTVSTIEVVGAARVPSVRQLRDVVEKMFPFFVPVILPNDKNTTIFMQYRRVDRFEHTNGLLQTLRLIRDDPPDVMIQKVARSFGISELEASRRIDAELVNGKVPFIPLFLHTGTSVSMSLSERGVLCRVIGCTSAVQHRRLMKLVSLVVDVASSSDASFLGWVTRTSVVRKIRKSESHRDHPVLDRQQRYLEDWEEESDEDGDDGVSMDATMQETPIRQQETEEDEIDALFAAELGNNEASPSKHVNSNALSIALGSPTHDSLLKQIQRSDPSLFFFKGSKYSTKCGKVDGRQPIVVTKDELARMTPGAHTGAIAYGTTEAAAKNNRFICPDVWCPRSRVGMSFSQFAAKSKTCPIDDEIPVVSNNKYFNGKSRYPGFLNPSQHPDGICMPCCFSLPKQRVGTCSSEANPGFFEKIETTDRPQDRATSRSTPTADRDNDPKYLRNFRAPLDDGRYGLLPQSFTDVLGHKQLCGSRDDGSGQMGMHTNCFVRRGTTRHIQAFMSCMVWTLENPLAHDIKSLVLLIERHLTPDVFVTLNDGRLCRAIMRDVTSEGFRVNQQDLARFATWFTSEPASNYVRASALGRIVLEARGFVRGITSFSSEQERSQRVSKKDSRTTRRHTVLFDQTSMEFKREYVLYVAMQRYIDLLRDPSIVKGHEHLIDLCARPLPWLNPRLKNILMFENDDRENNDDVYFSCPFDGGHLERRLRLSDPLAIIVRRGESYHPIVRVRMSRRDGIEEQRDFYYDLDRFVHQLVYRILEGCKGGGSDAFPDITGSLITGLATLGHPAAWQVLDYNVRLVGFLTADKNYISFPNPVAPLVGKSANALGTLYISDAMSMMALDKGRAAVVGDLIEGLRRFTGIKFESPQLQVQTAFTRAHLLEHLGVFVGLPIEDDRIKIRQGMLVAREDTSTLVDTFRSALWKDANAASELAFLRHGFNPLPPNVRRRMLSGLVRRLVVGSDPSILSRFVNSLLYDDDPLQNRSTAALSSGDMTSSDNAIVVTDANLLSTPLDEILVRGLVSFEGPPSGLEVVSIPGARVNRDAERVSRTSISHSGSGSLASLRKSLFVTSIAPITSITSSGSSQRSSDNVTSVIPGTRMIRCHPWKAIALAHQLIHTEIRVSVDAPMLIMMNDWLGSGKDKPDISPEDKAYLPSRRDIRILSRVLEVPVILIEDYKVVLAHNPVHSELSIVIAHTSNNRWYVVMDDRGRLFWTPDCVEKIQSRLQKKSASVFT